MIDSGFQTAMSITGDSTPIIWICIVAAVAIIGIIVSLVMLKRRGGPEDHDDGGSNGPEGSIPVPNIMSINENDMDLDFRAVNDTSGHKGNDSFGGNQSGAPAKRGKHAR